MPEMKKVQAVDGLLFPHAPPRAGFVGWRDAQPGEEPEHIIPRKDNKGRSANVHLVRSGVVEVPNTAHYRRGIARGDIQQAESAPVAKPDALTESED
jgi:hypothetical protein